MSEIVLASEIVPEIDWDNPLTSSLAALFFFDGTNVVEVVSDTIQTTGSPVASSTRDDSWSGTVSFDLNNLTWQSPQNSYQTILYKGGLSIRTTGTSGDLITLSNNSSSNDVFFREDNNYSGTYPSVGGNYSAGNNTDFPLATDSEFLGFIYQLYISSRTYISHKEYSGGVINEGGQGQSGGTAQLDTITLHSGNMELVVIYDAELDLATIQAIEDNPYQLFKIKNETVELFGTLSINSSAVVSQFGNKKSTGSNALLSTTNANVLGYKHAQATTNLLSTSNLVSTGNKFSFSVAQNNANSVIDTAGTKHSFGVSNINVTTSFTISGTAAELIIKSGTASFSAVTNISSVGYKSSLANVAITQLTRTNVAGYKYALASASFSITTNEQSLGVKASHGSESEAQSTALNLLGTKHSFGNNSLLTSTIVIALGIGGSFVSISRKIIIPGRINSLVLNGQISSGLTIQGII